MEQGELLALLGEGEGPRIEWKQQLDIKGQKAKEEFVKNLTAMANTTPGCGYILYGVTDEGHIIGIPRKEGIEETLQQIASSRCQPPVQFLGEWVDINGRSVFVIRVPESQIRPHATRQRDVYVRRQSIVDKVAPIEIFRMMSIGSKVARNEDSYQQPLVEYDITRFTKYDLGLFPLSGVPQAYRTCSKSGDFDDPATCPVFMPQFGVFVPEPEFGDSKSAIYFEWETNDISVERETFRAFLNSIERKIVSLYGKAGIWNSYPMSWSYSKDNEMDYGLGAENAFLALSSGSGNGLFGGIIQFERASVSKPTNLFVLFAETYSEDKFDLRTLSLKMILSSIPLSRDWVNDMFEVATILGEDADRRGYPYHKVGDDALSEPFYTLRWVPPQRRAKFKPKTIGLLGRDPGSAPQFDIGLGVVVDAEPLHKVEYSMDIEESWHSEAYGSVFKSPASSAFDEIPIQITNPIPMRMDMLSENFTISIPTIREAIVGVAGFVMIAINAHSFFIRG